jgi:hypothetical protein
MKKKKQFKIWYLIIPLIIILLIAIIFIGPVILTAYPGEEFTWRELTGYEQHTAYGSTDSGPWWGTISGHDTDSEIVLKCHSSADASTSSTIFVFEDIEEITNIDVFSSASISSSDQAISSAYFSIEQDRKTIYREGLQGDLYSSGVTGDYPQGISMTFQEGKIVILGLGLVQINVSPIILRFHTDCTTTANGRNAEASIKISDIDETRRICKPAEITNKSCDDNKLLYFECIENEWEEKEVPCKDTCNPQTLSCEIITIKDCNSEGCPTDYTCNEDSGVCEKETVSDCKTLGCQGDYTCNQNTGVCERISVTDCNTEGCPTDFICNSESGVCEEVIKTDCNIMPCIEGFDCNEETGICSKETIIKEIPLWIWIVLGILILGIITVTIILIKR